MNIKQYVRQHQTFYMLFEFI